MAGQSQAIAPAKRTILVPNHNCKNFGDRSEPVPRIPVSVALMPWDNEAPQAMERA